MSSKSDADHAAAEVIPISAASDPSPTVVLIPAAAAPDQPPKPPMYEETKDFTMEIKVLGILPIVYVETRSKNVKEGTDSASASASSGVTPAQTEFAGAIGTFAGKFFGSFWKTQG